LLRKNPPEKIVIIYKQGKYFFKCYFEIDYLRLMEAVFSLIPFLMTSWL
jgi:hypothetical protein